MVAHPRMAADEPCGRTKRWTGAADAIGGMAGLNDRRPVIVVVLATIKRETEGWASRSNTSQTRMCRSKRRRRSFCRYARTGQPALALVRANPLFGYARLWRTSLRSEQAEPDADPAERAEAESYHTEKNDLEFLLDKLCEISKRFEVDWTIQLEGEEIGSIHDGSCDPAVRDAVEAMAGRGRASGNLATSCRLVATFTERSQNHRLQPSGGLGPS